MVEFRILGAFEAVVAGRDELSLGSAQQRAVLALLLVYAPEAVSRDRLIDELWGERPPATAAHAVQVYVSGIRKALRPAGDAVAVRSSPAGYVLDVEAERVDARRFERLIEDAQRLLGDDPAGARGLFERALGLWRGRPLAEFEEFEWARREADRLEELRAVGLEGLVEARLACGEHGEVIGTLTGLVAASPLRERPRRLLMLALYRAGRHAEALAAYRDACAALDEIGLQPGPQLRELERAILQHDPSLADPQQAHGDWGAIVVPVPSVASAAAAGASAPVTVEPQKRAGESPGVRRRKVVTALFCDVMVSSELDEELDPEALQGVLTRCFRELRSVIERHGGTVEKFRGDAVMALFGVPQVHEDDALRAVRAAAAIRERLPAVADELSVALTFRAGIDTGVVLSGEREYLAMGHAVTVAAGLEQAGAPGEILLGEDTVRLVRDAVEVEQLEPLEVKGKSEPEPAFRLVRIDPNAPGLRRHLDAPLVGRQRELGLLRSAWNRTVEESGCHLFTLLGIAGVGKSRLVSELVADVGSDAMVLSGRCLHYGEGITFWPLIESLSTIGDRARDVVERLGSGGVAVPEELFFEVRRLLESLALERPVILHIDDLQWAEAMLLDLLDHVVELSRGAPILLLCSARPELLEDRPTWGGGKLNATAVLLEPLAATDCSLLLDQLGDGLAPDARARVIAASEGNPLFLEEMAALTRERGALVVPPTIQALLAARLERLPVGERELLERGAIEGEVFHGLPLRTLSDKPAADLEGAIAGLVRKELIRPHPSTFRGDDAFRFRHLLIRDAAYDGLPKAIRAELHERFATWLEQVDSNLAEREEIAGWHLEQAVRYQRELGRQPDPAVARGAAAHLHQAGRRASARGDRAAARSLLERALQLAPDDRAGRAAVAVDLAERLIDEGELGRADELLAAVERDPEVAAYAMLNRLEWLVRARPREATAAIKAKLPGLLEQLARAGDERGLAMAHMVAMSVQWDGGRITAAMDEARLAAVHAEAAGDEGLRSRAISWYVAGLGLGPAHAGEIERELDALVQDNPGVFLNAWIDIVRGEARHLEGRLDAARELARRGVERLAELGVTVEGGSSWQALALIEVTAGDPSAARESLLRCDAIMASFGEEGFRSTIQADLAEVYELLGDRAAAQRAIEFSDRLTSPVDEINPIVTHRVRARLALAEDDPEAAERWARSAVEKAFRTEFVVQQGKAKLELARVLSALGRREQASSEARAALDRFAAKGDRPGARTAEALLEELTSR